MPRMDDAATGSCLELEKADRNLRDISMNFFKIEVFNAKLDPRRTRFFKYIELKLLFTS
jgi:hypothetical protein